MEKPRSGEKNRRGDPSDSSAKYSTINTDSFTLIHIKLVRVGAPVALVVSVKVSTTHTFCFLTKRKKLVTVIEGSFLRRKASTENSAKIIDCNINTRIAKTAGVLRMIAKPDPRLYTFKGYQRMRPFSRVSVLNINGSLA